MYALVVVTKQTQHFYNYKCLLIRFFNEFSNNIAATFYKTNYILFWVAQNNTCIFQKHYIPFQLQIFLLWIFTVTATLEDQVTAYFRVGIAQIPARLYTAM